MLAAPGDAIEKGCGGTTAFPRSDTSMSTNTVPLFEVEPGEVSIAALRWAFTTKLPSGIRFTLVAIADRMPDSGAGWYVTLSDVAARTGKSRRRVVDDVKQLESVGAITVRRGGPRKTSHYVVNVGATIREPQRFPRETAEVPMGLRSTPPYSSRTPPSSANALAGTLRVPVRVPRVDSNYANKGMGTPSMQLSEIDRGTSARRGTTTAGGCVSNPTPAKPLAPRIGG